MKKSTLLFAALSAFIVTRAVAAPIFDNSNYTSDITFAENMGSTTMPIAYDGVNYWSATGGGTSAPYAQYDSAGNPVAIFNPGIDFRSVFTDDNNDVFANGYNSRDILRQVTPGSFTNYLTLSGGALNAQSHVSLNNDGEYVAMQSGAVSVWDDSGLFSSSFSLAGYVGGSGGHMNFTAAEDYLLGLFGTTLYAWDYSGALLDSTTLIGSNSQIYSLSYANDHVFVINSSGNQWNGYDVGLSTSTSAVPEPSIIALFALGLVGIGFARRRQS
jgi:hypothetical protein